MVLLIAETGLYGVKLFRKSLQLTENKNIPQINVYFISVAKSDNK
jgi:hypothetical protein